VAERRLGLKAKGVLLEEVVAVSDGPEELFADEEESFVDLAKELEEELAEEEALVEEATGRGKEEAVLEDVFREFQRGVEEQLSEEDSDTHFNLGIAYKEMGLLPEAIREFQVSSRDGQLFVESCSMIGVCYMEQGMWSQAAEWYQKALEAPDLSTEAQLALRYDLASSLESAGDLEQAMGFYEAVIAVNPAYRDVSERLDSLSAGGQVN
jgi:tetratricopeptide (TPR) repeat protein